MSEQNATTAASLAASLPPRAAETWKRFDEGMAAVAGLLTPAKFRITARAARELVHPEPLHDRHERAASDRAVWSPPELDGSATVSGSMSAADAHAAMTRIDAIARNLARRPGENRTLAQLRSDVFVDLLVGGVTDAAPATIRATVAITVPALTLLGASEEPAMLEGYGPIDLETARELAGSATSWVRVLTDPVSGTVLDVDRRTYRVPADLRRWVELTRATCAFPGCSRLARDCDLDHRLDWQLGGATSDDNLDPACEHHHMVKHGTQWVSYRCPTTGVTWWVSPTGARSASDPAPF